MTNAIPSERAEVAPGLSGLGARLADRGLLLGVALVTCLVSLPRFHGLMLSANERDARQAIELLEGELAGNLALAARGWPAIASLPSVEHRLVDLRTSADGRLATYHGYVLRIVQVEGRAGLLAWPAEPGRSGREAYLRRLHGETLASDDWASIGFPPRAPQGPTGNGWRPVR